MPNETNVFLAQQESHILSYRMNYNNDRGYQISVISHFANDPSDPRVISIRETLHQIPQFNSEETVYVPFAYNTADEEHLLFSFLVKNQDAAENVSRLEIMLTLHTNGLNPEEEFLFNVTFGKRLDLSTATHSSPTDESTTAVPVFTTPESTHTEPISTENESTPFMNCNNSLVDEIRSVSKAVQSVCETCTIDQGTTLIGTMIPIICIACFLIATNLILTICLCYSVRHIMAAVNSNSKTIQHLGLEGTNDNQRPQMDKRLPANGSRGKTQSGPWPSSRDIHMMPTFVHLMQRGVEESSEYNSMSGASSVFL